MTENPYATPKTPSDQMAEGLSAPEPNNLSAFRVGDIFFCEDNYSAPNVCLKTGLHVSAEDCRVILWDKLAKLEVYFDKGYLRKTGLRSRLMLWTVLILVFFSLFMGNFFIYFVSFITVILLFFVCMILPKSESIKVELQSNGLLKVTGAHPEFLKLFPDRTE